MPSCRASHDAEALCAELRRVAGLSDGQLLDLALVLHTWPATTLRASLVHLKHAERVQFARQSLILGNALPIVRDRLMACYGVSRRSAYRCLSDALAMGPR